ncbi:MAG: PKD domain-containing protein, partial [Saprospiraceae bacterium]
MRKHSLFLAAIFACSFPAANAQISGIINRYTPVSAIDTCSGRLSVADTAGFRVGAAVLLIQMQGAEISTANSPFYGIVTAMNFVGRHERAVIDSVGATDVFVEKRLSYSFSLPGRLQLVSIPQFADVTVADTLRAKPWDGLTGGVLAFDVSGTLTLNAPIVVNGAGFRGGADYVATGNTCNAITPILGYFFGLGNWRGGYKGEGIALPAPNQELGRGPRANGGGGGNDHNAGGGGGANVTNGGTGGNNADPNPFGCNGYFPGIGGYAPLSTTNRMFLGGGGGAGHSNNLMRSKGGNGGGIVLLKAGAIAGTAPAIFAQGTGAGLSLSDGAGGGGAGGTIWLDLAVPNPNLILNANGGRGGNADNNNVDRCMGPGGGGAGGRILTNAQPGIFSVTGGAAGITVNSTIGCNNSSNSGAAGELGEIQPLSTIAQGTLDYFLPQVLAAPQPDTVCAGQNALFTLLTNDGGWDLQWQVNTGTGWQDIAAGGIFVGFQSDSLLVQNPTPAQHGYLFRCRVLRAGCYEITSGAAGLFITAAPTVGFSVTTSGTTATFSNLSTNVTSYFWDFGDGTSSTLPNPMHTYATEGTFIVTLYAISACDTAVLGQTLFILLPPSAGFSVPATMAACDFVSLTFQNLSVGTALTFEWLFPGGTPNASSAANPTVVYQNSGTYTATLKVTNAAGSNMTSQSFVLTVTEAPTATFTFSGQNTGTVQFMSQTTNATNFLWNFGDPASGSNTSIVQNPMHTYTTEGDFAATLTVWNQCDTVVVQQTVSVFLPPTAGFSVPATVVGCGEAQMNFQNLSSANVVSFAWAFPGGSPASSTLENPSVAYAAPGTYTVRLIVTNTVGKDTLERTFEVEIFGLPNADFSFQTLPGGLVQFSNLSQNGDSYTWDFGDGSPQQSG